MVRVFGCPLWLPFATHQDSTGGSGLGHLVSGGSNPATLRAAALFPLAARKLPLIDFARWTWLPERARSMYSIYDEGLGRLMTTGRNNPTKEAAKEALLHYLSGSCSKVELAALSTLTPDEVAARHNFKIFKHLTPYPTDKQYTSL